MKRTLPVCNDPEKLDFLDGMKLCLDGLVARYQTYGAQAAALAKVERNAERKAALLQLANAFSHIPLKPATNFFEAVQFTWLAFLTAPDSLGRIDQYLYTFYKRDLDSETITEDFAVELLEELFIKVHESQADNKGLDIGKPSPWAAEACRWAVENGLFAGDGNGEYNWQQPVTREQLACILKKSSGN